MGKLRDEQGLTLVEVMAVIIIIGVIAAITLPSFINREESGYESKAKQQLNTAYKAARASMLDRSEQTNGNYPSVNRVVNAIRSSEPQYTVTSSASLYPNALTTDAVTVTATFGDSIVLAYKSPNGEVYTLTAIDNRRQLFASSPRQATRNRIAYASTRSGKGDIYTISDTGADERNLTSGDSCQNSTPNWSLNQEWIAYASLCGSVSRIMKMRPDGSDKTQVAANSYNNVEPAFAPDNARIAYASNRGGEKDILVAEVDGSHETNITANGCNDSDPAWSPDGGKIAFGRVCGGGLSQIVVMEADGSNPQVVGDSAYANTHPSWSPDGSLVTYASARPGSWSNIYYVDPKTNTETAVTGSGSVNRNPAWAPDGSRIYFTRTVSGTDRIYYRPTDFSVSATQLFANGFSNQTPN